MVTGSKCDQDRLQSVSHFSHVATVIGAEQTSAPAREAARTRQLTPAIVGEAAGRCRSRAYR